MKIIFCTDPLQPASPDRAYDAEVEAARAANLEFELINFERLVGDDNALAAVRRIRARETPEIALYRGWMLRPQIYQKLYFALQELNLTLINDPQSYRHCHYLPESYSLIEEATAPTVWLPLPECLEINKIMEKLILFGDKPLILKDYVKSRKHEWNEACYISSASNRESVEKVVARFIELQGEELNEGLVFRQWMPLRKIGEHPVSAMPISHEFRLFFLDGELLQSSHYWARESDKNAVPLEQFEAIARRIQSRFFTMDVAQLVDGRWMIVELGDGQVAGLPDLSEAARFYREIGRKLGA